MSTSPATDLTTSKRRRRIPTDSLTLVGVIALELLFFSLLGTNFLSPKNAFQLLRLNAELGLIALALTPIILSGGIDLSVGSTMGLVAVCFGKLAIDFGVPIPLAIIAALVVGAVAGAVNGFFIARLRIPPLIVTLGTLSLYRGIAEGITAGAANYTGFDTGFLWLGQGNLGPIPVQALFLIVAACMFYVFQHRTTIGREVSAIGYSPEGARYAAIPVDRRLFWLYVVSGICAALAAVLYVARVGQAKADVGTGYELSAITAIVLGGTSIFGGRGSIVGTLLGLVALALLENGLRLADGPPELAGILKGILLLLAIGADRWRAAIVAGSRTTVTDSSEEWDMKNSQLAALCGTILLASLIVLGSNIILVRGLQDAVSGIGKSAPSPAVAAKSPDLPPPGAKRLTIGMMPKSKGNAYFIACQKGAEEAAKELGVNLLWDGPTDTDPAKQNEIVDTWITRGVDAIAVSVENRDGLSTALRQARAKGIKVVTFDADALPDARDLFVNQATPEGIGNVLMDNAAKTLGGKGEFAIITATLTAANQNEWMKWIEKRRAAKYPGIKMIAVRPCDDQQPKAFEEARTLLNANKNLGLIMAISSAAVPGAAEAVKQSGRKDVHVVGLGLPNDNKPYVKSGITTSVVLWKTADLGYLAVQTAASLANKNLDPTASEFSAGRLGRIELKGDNVMLGVPFSFTKENIDQFDF